MIRTNLEQCVEIAVSGEILSPSLEPGSDRRLGVDGAPVAGGLAYGLVLNVKVGDSAIGWAGGDEVEPGAAVSAPCCDETAAALELLSCVGNEAIVTEAAFEGKDVKVKGASGTVTGKGHGRVSVHFPKKVLEKLVAGDSIQIRTQGLGLRFSDYPEIAVFNLGPRLLKAMNVTEKSGKVRIQVTKIIPGRLLGSGMGGDNPQRGHFDIQSTSAEDQKLLEQVKLGDLVTIMDVEASHGPRWQKDATTIAVVTHGSSRRSGHGIGVNAILSSAKGQIEPIIMSKANVANFLGLA